MKKEEKRDLSVDWRLIGAVFAVAIVVRLVYLVEFSSSMFFESLFGDARFYDLWAENILDGSIFPETALYRTPLYSYFLALFYGVSGSSRFFVGIIQAIVGSMSCILVYMIARRYFAEKVALVAGLICALYGIFIYFDATLSPISLTAFLSLCCLYWLSGIDAKSGLRTYLVAGIFLGLASINSQTVMLFAVFVLVWILIRFKATLSTQLTRWAVFLCGMAIVILPVTAHNLSKSGTPTLIASNAFINVFAGNNIQADGITSTIPGNDPEIMRDYDRARSLAGSTTRKELSPFGVCSFYRNEAIAFVKTHPTDALSLTARRIYLLLNGTERLAEESLELRREDSTIMSVLIWEKLISFPAGLLVPLFLAGLVATFRNRRKLILLYCFLVSLAIVPALTFVNSGIRTPVMYVAIMFASAGIFEFISIATKKKRTAWAAPVIVGAIALVIANVNLVETKSSAARDYERIASSLVISGDYGEAEKFYRKGLEIEPDSPDLLNGVGEIYMQAKVYQEAEKKFRRALMSKPDHFAALKNLASIHQQRQQPEALRASLANLLKYYPSSQWGLLHMAEYFIGIQENDSAYVYYDRLVKMHPQNPEGRFGLGNAALKTGRPEQARDIYEDMVQQFPEEPEIHLNLGLAYAQLEKYHLAEEEFTTTLYYDSTNTFALYNLGRIFEVAGDTAMATSMFLRILTIDPEFYEDPESILKIFLEHSEEAELPGRK